MEEENTDQTYAYENTTNSEAIFKIKKEELKSLKKKAARDREVRLANNAQNRAIRDDKIDRITLRLQTIKGYITKYNRAGKREKDRTDILGMIYMLIGSDIELNEEIERTKPEMTMEEVEAEVVDESEITLE